MPTQVILEQPREVVTLHLDWSTHPPMRLLLSFTELQILGAVRGTTDRGNRELPRPPLLTSRSRIQGVRGSKPGKRILRSFSSLMRTFTLQGKRPSSGKEFGQNLPHLSARAEAISNSMLSPFSPFKFAYLR